MEIVRSQKKVPTTVDCVQTIQQYKSVPALEVKLEDFELFAIDRLRAPKAISDGLSRGKKHEEMQKLATDLWRANMRHPDPSEVINKDIISHFVLRLVYCRTEDLRKWFLANEIALFRYHLNWESAEVQNAKEKLSQVACSINQPLPGTDTAIFKVPFEEVPDLVAGRRVYIHKGHTYAAPNQGAGLKLDDALAFWKAEFSQMAGIERFDKECAYSIHHNYGKEGKRMDYTPYSCQKIISSTPGVGDHHGCPYRHFRCMWKILLCAQLACTLTFETVHSTSSDAGINHPNQYYSDSLHSKANTTA